MSVRKILALKRASIQTQIDALVAKEAGLLQQRTRLGAQGDGLELGQADAGFQIAAMANRSARAVIARLDRDAQAFQAQRLTLAREKLSLDIADKKLANEERKRARVDAARAEDRV
jgi:alpha-D-ribose 1-methylphosphonate 5-triphosphate synthase subunit PhnG